MGSSVILTCLYSVHNVRFVLRSNSALWILITATYYSFSNQPTHEKLFDTFSFSCSRCHPHQIGNDPIPISTVEFRRWPSHANAERQRTEKNKTSSISLVNHWEAELSLSKLLKSNIFQLFEVFWNVNCYAILINAVNTKKNRLILQFCRADKYNVCIWIFRRISLAYFTNGHICVQCSPVHSIRWVFSRANVNLWCPLPYSIEVECTLFFLVQKYLNSMVYSRIVASKRIFCI